MLKYKKKNHKNSEVKLTSIVRVLGWVVTLGDIRQMKRRGMDKVLPTPILKALASKTRHLNAMFFKN
jgi:hypothetical protein